MFTGELRKYQEPALDRMLERGRLIVAYDMGTGKTPISIAATEELLETGKVECGLVVVLASLKYQWEAQLKKFSDNARVVVIDGDPAARKKQYLRAQKYLYEYVILSYDNIVRDFEDVVKIPIQFMVCDEATAIKGFRAKRSKATKQIRPHYRFALTGQPIENRPEELFSIMQWVDPKVLGNFMQFEKTFIKRGSSGQVSHYRNLRLLNKLMADVMVRKKRTDPDVQAEMPLVVEPSPTLVDFDTAGRAFYRKVGKELLQLLYTMPKGSFNIFAHYGASDDAESAQARGDVMARLTCLRMLCDHPDLLRHSAELYAKTMHDKKPKGSKYVHELSQAGLLTPLKTSPKLAEAKELIEELLSADPANKIVLFSYYPMMLRYVASKIGTFTKSVFLTGTMKPRDRQTSIEQFNEDPHTRLFLSSDAGGYGVDLPGGNYLINLDLPWSAGKMQQRNSRIVRLASTFESVTVINMLMNRSIEERMYDTLVQKAAVASAWVDGKGLKGERGTFHLTLDTLTAFLEETL